VLIPSLGLLIDAYPAADETWTLQTWLAKPGPEWVDSFRYDPASASLFVLAAHVAAVERPADLTVTMRPPLLEHRPDAAVIAAFCSQMTLSVVDARNTAGLQPLKARIPALLGLRLISGKSTLRGGWHRYPVQLTVNWGPGTADLHIHEPYPAPGSGSNGHHNRLWEAQRPLPPGCRSLAFPEITDLFCNLAADLHRAPFLYEFAHATHPAGQPTWILAHTQEDALAQANARRKAARVSPIGRLVNADVRVFPDPTPDFRVLPSGQ
jgi:hypothetical protein